MWSKISIAALASSLSLVHAVHQGFNFASTNANKKPLTLDEWKAAFSTQSGLPGTDGAFTSARLYTMVRDETSSTVDPILAFQAAHDDGKTTLLLGLWVSGGQAGVDKEIAAMKKAISQFPDLYKQIVGISVGSEDLYRVSKIANDTNAKNPPEKQLGPGVFPDQMLSYVDQVQGNLTGDWANLPIGHVDTWTAYTNSDGSFDQPTLTRFIESLDFLGVDSYPYFQGTMDNGIEVSSDLFIEAYQKVLAVASGREVWITETGWPSSGPTQNLAVASVDNAQSYWQMVGCPNFGKINTWWYTLSDANDDPMFGVVPSLSGGNPFWDLSCSGHTDAPDAAQASLSPNSTAHGNSTSSGNSTSTNSNSTSGGNSGSGSQTSTGASGSASPSGGNGSNGRSGASMVTFSSVLAMGVGALAFMVAL